ncbi:aminodeoxychorismate/anthranilate synthase component II [Ancylobacter pratisalsi]|uniref:Aminodeoxychorismate/anthranilate synthase component II n=1 Tax=Ancylobacter pratisalsi TaxID=1745854 RepID=A0A6P1YRG2_9HYPH|nr:aminodeoxychorismate/anthranilate synthase component II [Ancylobacter pratisalsi]
MILLIDNYDSFVFNVARYLTELGAEVDVARNDALDLGAIEALRPDALVISPGPCSPNEAGVSLAAVAALSGRLPILGICLGHQCIGQAFGGRVVRAGEPMHGRASQVHHLGSDVFAGLPTPFPAARYHSLAVELEDTTALRPTAWSEDGEIMGLAHRQHPTYGVQFHPESVLTDHGYDLLANFLSLARSFGTLRDAAQDVTAQDVTARDVAAPNPTAPNPAARPRDGRDQEQPA